MSVAGERVLVMVSNIELFYLCARERLRSRLGAPRPRGRASLDLCGGSLGQAARDQRYLLTTHKRRAGAHEFYRRMGYKATGYRFWKVL
jgi:hypothetical protein